MNDFKDVALCEPVAVVKPLSDTDPLWSAAADATSPVICSLSLRPSPVRAFRLLPANQLFSANRPSSLLSLGLAYTSSARHITLHVYSLLLLRSCPPMSYCLLYPAISLHVSISSPSTYFWFCWLCLSDIAERDLNRYVFTTSKQVQLTMILSHN